MNQMLGLVCHRLPAALLGNVLQHRGGVVVGDRGKSALIPAIDATDALQGIVHPVSATELAQLRLVVQIDRLGVGLSFF